MNFTKSLEHSGKLKRRTKREISKGDQCKAMELGGKIASTANDIVNDVSTIPIIGDFLGFFTAGISVVTHLFSGSLDIAQTAADCGDVPFDEIKDIMNKRFNEIDRKLDEQTSALREITMLVNRTLSAVEHTRHEMHTRFDEVMESIGITQVNPIISEINNFVQYFYAESEDIKGLNIQDYVDKLIGKDGNFLNYLAEYRTPRGLLAFLLNLIKQEYAVPKNSRDKAAFKAIDALIYGTQTYVEVMFFLTEQYAYLVNHYYHNSDVDNYNKYLSAMIHNFKHFRKSLLGTGIAGKEEPLLIRVIDLLKEVNNLDFVWAVKAKRFTDSIRSLESIKRQVYNMALPVIEDIPQNYVQFSFKKNVKTPIGDWVSGKYVSYAVQYQSDDKYAKIGEWSDPVLVQGKACPTLKMPFDKLRRDRLLFRKFEGERPKLVGVIKGDETEFTDINRDFYDAVDNPDKAASMRDARILLMEGADQNAVFEDGRRALHAAAKWGNEEVALSLLLGKPDTNINARDKDGITPVHVAVEAGQDEFVNLLMRYRCSASVPTYPSLLTPLHMAARNGFTKTVETLLKARNVNLNARDMSGFTPLHNAVVGGERTVSMIINSGKADINAQSNTKLTPFHLAVINNDMKVAQTLIGSKLVDVNAGDENNMTPLHHAAMMGHIDMVNYLLSMNEIEVNKKTSDNEWTPLHYAIFFRKDKVSKRLMEDGRLKLRTNAQGWLTALHFAVTFGRKDVLLPMIKRGVLIDQPTREGYTSLHLAAMRESPTMLNILIQNNANVNARTFQNSTPLHEAAFRGRLENVIVLLDKKADLQAVDEFGNTPVHKASFSGAISVVDLLLKRDSSFLEKENKFKETPLLMASKNTNGDVVKFLRNKGAAVNVVNSDGETPLHMFAKVGQLEMIEYLIRNGVPIYNYDKLKNDFLYYAIQNGHIDIVKYAFEKQKYDYKVMEKHHISFRCPKTCPWVMCDANEFDQLDMIKYFFNKIDSTCSLVNEAAVYGHLDIIKYFIRERKASIERESSISDPPLCSAAQSGHLNVVKYLIERDANANGKCGNNGILNNVVLAKMKTETRLEIVSLLLMKGADVSKSDGVGYLPIHNAVVRSDLALVRLLVEEFNVPLNVQTKDEFEDTPLHIAVGMNSLPVVKYLVEKGADVQLKNKKNYTPYNIARNKNFTSIANFLEEKISRFYRSLFPGSLNEGGNLHFKTRPSNSATTNDNKLINGLGNERKQTFHNIFNFKSFHDNIDAVGTLFLFDVFLRSITGQKYINATSPSKSEDESLVEALTITEYLQNFLNSKPRTLLEKQIDFYEVYSNVKKAIRSKNNSKLHQILCTFVEAYDDFTPEAFQELLNTYIGKEKTEIFRMTFSLTHSSFSKLWNRAAKSCVAIGNTLKSIAV